MTTAKSEKADKQAANRRLRRITRERVPQFDTTSEILPISKETGNTWTMAKDGKQYLKKPSKKDLRK